MFTWRALSLSSALLVAYAVSAEDATFGNWTASTFDDGSGIFAVTINDSGDVLGEYCYYKQGNCKWMLGMHTHCKPGATGTVLANSGSGAMALDVVCFGPLPKSSISAYAFNDWKSLEAALKDSSRIGFAVALESDKFTVVRFSLVGRSDAQQAIEAVFLAKQNQPGESKAKNTVDQTL